MAETIRGADGNGSRARGELLWRPPPDVRVTSRMGRFLDEVARERGVDTSSYQAAWEWSVTDLEGFWSSLARHLEVDLGIDPPSSPGSVLPDATMPGATWFPGARLNYAEHALRRRGSDPAILARSQSREDREVSFDELADEVARAAAGLRRLGVGSGDRVVGYLPNVPETIVALLACASIGAIWSSCLPEFGSRAVVDRIAQLDPVVLLAVDGYRYGARTVDRAGEVAAIRAALPSLRATVLLAYLDDQIDPGRFPDVVPWDQLTDMDADLTFEPVAFDHPLYVLFSSGTTGLPKAIVHGHGGITLEHAKLLALHHDLDSRDRFCWFTTTGWMMWNYLVSGLVVGSTVVLFDGDPGHPDLSTLWRWVADAEVTVFGVGAPFLTGSRKAGLTPGAELDLTQLREIGSTGAPLPTEAFTWVYEHVGRDLRLASVSGGTDVCTAFVGGAPLVPVRAGEIACRCLGAKVEAFGPTGESLVGQRGELVLTAPMPSMPVAFWGDDGSRYRAAYFEDFPGVWRHGDWIEIHQDGSCVISGRSDATLNRGGVRMGTSEFYSAVEALDEVVDSLVVHVDDPACDGGRLVLFVHLAAGTVLDEALRGRIATTVRTQLSPRHVPDELHQVDVVPRTISGKKLEVPVKRLLEGEPLARVANVDSLADEDALEPFVALATRRFPSPGE